jgi:hypothetical protein
VALVVLLLLIIHLGRLQHQLVLVVLMQVEAAAVVCTVVEQVVAVVVVLEVQMPLLIQAAEAVEFAATQEKTQQVKMADQASSSFVTLVHKSVANARGNKQKL